MWHVKLKDGVELSECHLEVWDNVPTDAEIKKAAFVFPRQDEKGKQYVIELLGYERYCIARSISAAIANGVSERGYCLYGERRGVVSELEVRATGMRMKSYPIDQCQLPERCWRRGVL